MEQWPIHIYISAIFWKISVTALMRRRDGVPRRDGGADTLYLTCKAFRKYKRYKSY